MRHNTDLDVDAPDQVSRVLRNAADAYYESQIELQSCWQDKNAGADWRVIAKILERAADKIDKSITVYLRDSKESIAANREKYISELERQSESQSRD